MVEVSINFLVIISIAVIVLLGLLALALVGFFGPEQLIEATKAKRPCNILQLSLTNAYNGIVVCEESNPLFGTVKTRCSCNFYKKMNLNNITFGILEKTESYDIISRGE